MKKVLGLEDWIRDKTVPDNQRVIDVKIDLKHIDVSTLKDFTPAERKIKSRDFLKSNLQKLMDSNLLKEFQVNRIGKKPYSVNASVPYPGLSKLNKLDCTGYIWVKRVSDAKKTKQKPEIKHFCVKMTIAIQVEGKTKGRQTIEDRFIVIKAKSFEDAYDKTEKYASEYEYGEPYMNKYGELVRWKIESYDDCYEIGNNLNIELNWPEGAEVYSKMRTRNLKKEHVWDGK